MDESDNLRYRKHIDEVEEEFECGGVSLGPAPDNILRHEGEGS
jgi:hypothetical protein